MKPLQSIRQALSHLKEQIRSGQAEIEGLESDRAQLLSAPIRFDCWRESMLNAIDAQADRIPTAFAQKWRGAIEASESNRIYHYPLTDPFDRFSGEARLLAMAPFYGNRSVTDRFDCGLSMDVLVYLLRDELKQAFSKLIAPLRESWPPDVECGPPMKEREAMLKRIDERLGVLYSERDEALETLSEADVGSRQ